MALSSKNARCRSLFTTVFHWTCRTLLSCKPLYMIPPLSSLSLPFFLISPYFICLQQISAVSSFDEVCVSQTFCVYKEDRDLMIKLDKVTSSSLNKDFSPIFLHIWEKIYFSFSLNSEANTSEFEGNSLNCLKSIIT